MLARHNLMCDYNLELTLKNCKKWRPFCKKVLKLNYKNSIVGEHSSLVAHLLLVQGDHGSNPRVGAKYYLFVCEL